MKKITKITWIVNYLKFTYEVDQNIFFEQSY